MIAKYYSVTSKKTKHESGKHAPYFFHKLHDSHWVHISQNYTHHYHCHFAVDEKQKRLNKIHNDK